METTYKDFMEAKVKSWKDMKDRNVLGYTMAHSEFTIFRNEKEWKDSVKHGKDMKWIRVE